MRGTGAGTAARDGPDGLGDAVDRLEQRIRAPRRGRGPAAMPFLTGGFPDMARFGKLLDAVGRRSDVVEVGLPFSDPIADGPVLQRAGRTALAAGASLPAVLAEVSRRGADLGCELCLMSYLNPLLARGLERAVRWIAEAGFAGLIVPDLPLEESEELGGLCAASGLALVQLATPLTPPARLQAIAGAARGFLYAVPRPGITGAASALEDARPFLEEARRRSAVPVCVGFGIGERAQVEALSGLADGVIVGTALTRVIERGEDPARFLAALFPEATA